MRDYWLLCFKSLIHGGIAWLGGKSNGPPISAAEKRSDYRTDGDAEG
jgi:hypothetical protein